MKTCFLECHLSDCLFIYAWIYASLDHEWLDEFDHIWYLKSLSITSWCLMNVYSLDQKTGALHIGPYKQNGDLLEEGSDDFDYS
jgi:hypothetical protein